MKAWTPLFNFWTTVIQSAAVYGMGIMQITKELLEKAQIWKRKWLRKILHLRRHKNSTGQLEEWVEYLRRTKALIAKLFNVCSSLTLSHKIIKEYFRVAMKKGSAQSLRGVAIKPGARQQRRPPLNVVKKKAWYSLKRGIAKTLRQCWQVCMAHNGRSRSR